MKIWLSNEFDGKIFQRIALESCPMVHLEGGPMTVTEGLSSNSPRRVVQ